MNRDVIAKIFDKYTDYRGEDCVPVFELVGHNIDNVVDEIWDAFEPFVDMGWVAEKIKYLDKEVKELKNEQER